MYFILSKIIIKQESSVIEISHLVVPSGIGIGDGLASQCALAVFHALCFHPQFHGLHDGLGQLLPL